MYEVQVQVFLYLSKPGLPIHSNREDSLLPIAAFFIDWIVDWIASIFIDWIGIDEFSSIFFNCLKKIFT